MDYIIFRKNGGQYVRFTDGQIYLTGDKQEAIDEFNAEARDNTNPVLIELRYSSHRDWLNKEVWLVEMFIDNIKIGCFSYTNESGFWMQLENTEKDIKQIYALA